MRFDLSIYTNPFGSGFVSEIVKPEQVIIPRISINMSICGKWNLQIDFILIILYYDSHYWISQEFILYFFFSVISVVLHSVISFVDRYCDGRISFSFP